MIPSRDENVHHSARNILVHELDQEKVTGDFERHASNGDIAPYQQQHNFSYVDTYDPANKEDLYTNTTQPPSTTMNQSDSSYYVMSSSQHSKQNAYQNMPE